MLKKCLTFGTIRKDIVLFYDFTQTMTVYEHKLKECDIYIGGSVYNTSRYLTIYDESIFVTMYTWNNIKSVILNDKVREDQNNFCHETKTEYHSNSVDPFSIIGVRSDGEKNILSYDCIRNDQSALSYISDISNDYLIFYTSIYEVTKDNIEKLKNILKQRIQANQINIVDLCPLIGGMDLNELISVLSHVSIVSGTEEEYNTLLERLTLYSYEALMKSFSDIHELWIKQGSDGAKVIIRNEKLNIDSDEGQNQNEFIYHKTNAVKIDRVMNTTGCGDVFNAILIHGVLREKRYKDVLECAVIESAIVAERGLPWRTKKC